MNIAGSDRDSHRCHDKANHSRWYYSDKKARKSAQHEFSDFTYENSSYHTYNRNYQSDGFWNRGRFRKHRGNDDTVSDHQDNKEESSLNWIKQYEDLLWDTYDDLKLDNCIFHENSTDGNNHYFSGLQINHKNEAVNVGSEDIPKEIVVQQAILLESEDDVVCIRCFKVHISRKCSKARCTLCSSRFHVPRVCPWKPEKNDPIRLCKTCNGGSYYLNSRLSYLTYRRHVCNNYYDAKSGKFAEEAAKTSRMYPCIKKGYEESILMLGNENSEKTMEDFDIECYNCSEVGHIICNNEVPFKDVIKTTYCALCGCTGHSYQLCNKFLKPNPNRNMPGNIKYEYKSYYHSNYCESSDDQRESDESDEDSDDYSDDSSEDEGGEKGEDYCNDKVCRRGGKRRRKGDNMRNGGHKRCRMRGGKRRRGDSGWGGRTRQDSDKEGCRMDGQEHREDDKEHRGSDRRHWRNHKWRGKNHRGRREDDGGEDYNEHRGGNHGPNGHSERNGERSKEETGKVREGSVTPDQSNSVKSMRFEPESQAGYLKIKMSSNSLNAMDTGFGENECFISTSTSSECDGAEELKELRAKTFQRMKGAIQRKLQSQYGSSTR